MYIIDQKNESIVKNAIEELLIGLVRIKKGSRFHTILNATERLEYKTFLDQRADKCFEEIKKKKKKPVAKAKKGAESTEA